ncbi:ribose 5-phosphate isomerase B [candidate division CSSED10-310 bacterium]|uniref:Ribose 5-phosphate isomerase B n=1 Tax=candidate division CSSED10-310 bacterium TaxID=2855610 RepID=A0ABV6YVA2_UNCC1
MDISIASDHGGYDLKQHLISYLKKLGYTIHDHGTQSKQSVDYPDFALKVALDVAHQKVPLGIIIDGAGIGSSIVANKIAQVRAALCNDLYTAQNAKEHNKANILVLGSQVVGPGMAEKIVEVFLKTPFAGGRHERRVKKIETIDARFRSVQGDVETNQIEEIVSNIVQNFLNQNQSNLALRPDSDKRKAVKKPELRTSSPGVNTSVSHLITEDDVKQAVRTGQSEIHVTSKTLITPLALDLIRDCKLELVQREIKR